MLTTRLEKLEKDLHLISAMQSLLMNDNHNVHNINFIQSMRNDVEMETPVRDESHTRRKRTPSLAAVFPQNDNSENDKKILDCVGDIRKGKTVQNKKRNKTQQPPVVQVQYESEDIADRNSKTQLDQDLEKEKSKRKEIEDAAKCISIKLQEVKDELDREKRTKKMLLVGTLELKNQIQSYESCISQLEAEIEKAKREKELLSERLEILSADRESTEQEFHDILNRLNSEKVEIENESLSLQDELQRVRQDYENLQRECLEKEKCLNVQDCKSNSQLSQLMNKCVQIDKERQKIAVELNRSTKRVEEIEGELRMTQESVAKLKSELSREKVLHECHIVRLKNDMKSQKQLVDKQMSSCHSVIGKTKEMILEIIKERDCAERNVQNLKRDNKELSHEREKLRRKVVQIESNLQQTKERLENIMSQKQECVYQLTREKTDIKKLVEERKKLLQAVSNVKCKLNEERRILEIKQDEQVKEKESISRELCTQKENFNILQKISQDQTNSIQKLKEDIDNLRKYKFSLEIQLREKDANEGILARKLEQEERKSFKLQEKLEESQEIISQMEDEMTNHDCEDCIESNWKSRVQEIESHLKSRYAQWQKCQGERDQAIQATRRVVNEMEVVKDKCEKRILEITSMSRQENSKLQLEHQKAMSEKTTKIYELESELERLRLHSTQIQRTLSGKISQLQCALNICLGSNPAAFTTNTTGIGGVGNLIL